MGLQSTCTCSQHKLNLFIRQRPHSNAREPFASRLQSLGTSMGDVYTLDGGKLSGRGVVVGSGFRVLPLEDAPVRFGAGQGPQV